MSRSLSAVLAVVVLVALVVWLLQPGVVPDADLGPARRLACHPASSVVALGKADGSWRVLDLAAPEAAPSAASATSAAEHAWRGQPVVTADGVVLALAEAGGRVVLHVLERPSGEPRPVPLPAEAAGDGLRLAGVSGPEARAVLVDDGSGAVWWLADDGWRVLADADGPADAEPGSLVALGDTRRVVAFRGASGWEAWRLDVDPPVRQVARDCHGAVAVFTPEGDALVLDGRQMNIYRLELADGRLAHMADGNLGHSPRVPWTTGVRGDPPLLVVPQFDLQGWLQLVQTNFSGGGRYQFNTGFEHHYLPAVSPAGRWLAYAQSPFDLDGDRPFEEDLYLFDFDDGNASAAALGTRVGGTPHRGPAWAARPDGVSLLWVADGRAWRLDRTD